jgi:hypothetical protein
MYLAGAIAIAGALSSSNSGSGTTISLTNSGSGKMIFLSQASGATGYAFHGQQNATTEPMMRLEHNFAVPAPMRCCRSPWREASPPHLAIGCNCGVWLRERGRVCGLFYRPVRVERADAHQ